MGFVDYLLKVRKECLHSTEKDRELERRDDRGNGEEATVRTEEKTID
jgi:hypothetical protein